MMLSLSKFLVNDQKFPVRQAKTLYAMQMEEMEFINWIVRLNMYAPSSISIGDERQKEQNNLLLSFC